ncbi:hypothetical protein [Streptomyces sp. NPDC006638]|uniref:glycoside hydrolase family protein n=1 Tax=Streptomyces sp. NPDC006638 TaxID=3157183 RepID=UPI0033A50279
MVRRRSSARRPLAALLVAAVAALPLLLTPAPAFATPLPACVTSGSGQVDPDAPAGDEGTQMTREQALSFVASRESSNGLDGDPHVHKNPQGRLTVGIGFDLDSPDARDLLDAVGADYDDVRSGAQDLRPDQIRFLFEVRFTAAEKALQTLIPGFDSLSGNRRAALMDVMFDAGPGQFNALTFKAMVNAVSQGQYSAAATQLQRTAWASQVGYRAKYDADMLRSGILCYSPPPVGVWWPNTNPIDDWRVGVMIDGYLHLPGGVVIGRPGGGAIQNFFKPEETCEATYLVIVNTTSIDIVTVMSCYTIMVPNS